MRTYQNEVCCIYRYAYVSLFNICLIHPFHRNVKIISSIPSIILGSPAILGDSDGEDGVSDCNYNTETQDQKQKSAERMLSWHMTYGRGEDVPPPNYDKKVPHNNIPLLPGREEVNL